MWLNHCIIIKWLISTPAALPSFSCNLFPWYFDENVPILWDVHLHHSLKFVPLIWCTMHAVNSEYRPGKKESYDTILIFIRRTSIETGRLGTWLLIWKHLLCKITAIMHNAIIFLFFFMFTYSHTNMKICSLIEETFPHCIQRPKILVEMF